MKAKNSTAPANSSFYSDMNVRVSITETTIDSVKEKVQKLEDECGKLRDRINFLDGFWTCPKYVVSALLGSAVTLLAQFIANKLG